MTRSDRYALVTGAGGGIGRSICLHLARDGWHVAATDIDANAAAETATLVKEAGGVGVSAELDIRDAAAWVRLREHLQESWPALDLLVNNAGVTSAGLFERTTAETWDWVQEINLGGAIHGCRVMLPWLRQTPKLATDPRRAFVMNVASAAGVLVGPRKSAYNVSKAALVALSETLHHELKPHGVSTTAICPWYVPTKLVSRGKFDRTSEKAFTARVTRNSKLSADAVAREALRATFRGKNVCVVGRQAKALYLLKRWSPSFYSWMAGRLYLRAVPAGLEEIVPVNEYASAAKQAA